MDLARLRGPGGFLLAMSGRLGEDAKGHSEQVCSALLGDCHPWQWYLGNKAGPSCASGIPWRRGLCPEGELAETLAETSCCVHSIHDPVLVH